MNARLIARCTGPRPFDGACGFLRRFGWCGHFVMACDRSRRIATDGCSSGVAPPAACGGHPAPPRIRPDTTGS
jgi:hypothetical protein